MTAKIGWGCSSVSRASDWHDTDTGSIPRCGKGFSSQSQLSAQTLLRCPYTPVCGRMHSLLCARRRSCSLCQGSVDYGNTKTPGIHRGLGSATLSQLAFPWESNPNFRWEKSHWGNTLVESKWKKRTKKIGFRDSFAPCGSDATSGGCAEFVTAPWSASCRWRTEHYIFHVLDFCRHRCRCRAEPPI